MTSMSHIESGKQQQPKDERLSERYTNVFSDLLGPIFTDKRLLSLVVAEVEAASTVPVVDEALRRVEHLRKYIR